MLTDSADQQGERGGGRATAQGRAGGIVEKILAPPPTGMRHFRITRDSATGHSFIVSHRIASQPRNVTATAAPTIRNLVVTDICDLMAGVRLATMNTHRAAKTIMLISDHLLPRGRGKEERLAGSIQADRRDRDFWTAYAPERTGSNLAEAVREQTSAEAPGEDRIGPRRAGLPCQDRPSARLHPPPLLAEWGQDSADHRGGDPPPLPPEEDDQLILAPAGIRGGGEAKSRLRVTVKAGSTPGPSRWTRPNSSCSRADAPRGSRRGRPPRTPTRCPCP